MIINKYPYKQNIKKIKQEIKQIRRRINFNKHNILVKMTKNEKKIKLRKLLVNE